MFGFGYGTRAAGRSIGRTNLPDAPDIAPVTAILANGWQATYPGPPEFFDPESAPEVLIVTRPGFDHTGGPTTYADTLTVTTRVRSAYPDQAGLTADTVALCDYIYADDVIAGVANNSAEDSPKPVAQWLTPHRAVIGNAIGGSAYPVEIAAFHRNARSGSQVACVVFTVTDGTTALTSTVTASTVSGRAGDRNAVLAYKLPEVDITSLNTGLITVNAKVYPHIGVAASVLDSADKSDSTQFSPRYFLKNAALHAAPPLVYVSATGDDTTGVVSTDPATAAASPCLTIGGAIARINAAYSATTGIDGAEIRLGSGSFAMGSVPSGFAVQKVAAITITRDPTVARADAIAAIAGTNVRMRFSASFTAPIATGALRFKDVSFARSGAGVLQGETSEFLDVSMEEVNYDGGGIGSISLFRTNCSWFGCAMANLTDAAMGSANTGNHAIFRGIDFSSAVGLQALCIVGCDTVDGSLANNTNAGANGVVIAFNQFKAITGDFINWRHVADTAEGAAIVQNVFEFCGGSSNYTLGVNHDSGTNDFAHLILHANTFAGYDANGRINLHYDEGTAPRASKLASVKNNIIVQMNMKAMSSRRTATASATGGRATPLALRTISTFAKRWTTRCQAGGLRSVRTMAGWDCSRALPARRSQWTGPTIEAPPAAPRQAPAAAITRLARPARPRRLRPACCPTT